MREKHIAYPSSYGVPVSHTGTKRNESQNERKHPLPAVCLYSGLAPKTKRQNGNSVRNSDDTQAILLSVIRVVTKLAVFHIVSTN
jgi:hypothetical protein